MVYSSHFLKYISKSVEVLQRYLRVICASCNIEGAAMFVLMQSPLGYDVFACIVIKSNNCSKQTVFY